VVFVCVSQRSAKCVCLAEGRRRTADRSAGRDTLVLRIMQLRLSSARHVIETGVVAVMFRGETPKQIGERPPLVSVRSNVIEGLQIEESGPLTLGITQAVVRDNKGTLRYVPIVIVKENVCRSSVWAPDVTIDINNYVLRRLRVVDAKGMQRRERVKIGVCGEAGTIETDTSEEGYVDLLLREGRYSLYLFESPSEGGGPVSVDGAQDDAVIELSPPRIP